jgi:Protein of unknown function (DUF483)
MKSPVDFNSLAATWGCTRAHQLLMVAAALRPACRFTLSREQLPRMSETASLLSIKMLVGFDAIDSRSVVGRSGFSEWSQRAPLQPHRLGNTYVYLCADHVQGQRLRRYDEAGDDSSVGELLGYPACCVEAFGKGEHNSQDDPVLQRYCDSSAISWYMNVSLLCFDSTLLSHVPCSPHCEASAKLARGFYDFLCASEAGAARRLKDVLSARVLHTKMLGIVAFIAVEEGLGLKVTEVLKADEGSTLGTLLAAGSVVSREEGGVFIDSCFLTGEQTRLFHFV